MNEMLSVARASRASLLFPLYVLKKSDPLLTIPQIWMKDRPPFPASNLKNRHHTSLFSPMAKEKGGRWGGRRKKRSGTGESEAGNDAWRKHATKGRKVIVSRRIAQW